LEYFDKDSASIFYPDLPELVASTHGTQLRREHKLHRQSAMLTVLDHPLVKRDITVLRDSETSTPVFRATMRRIGALLAAEAARHIQLRTVQVRTPLEVTDGAVFAGDVILVPVLRAGAGLVEPFLDIIPDAKIGYMGLRRNEETLQTEEYYFNSPKPHRDSLVLLLDPMLATGGSVCSSLERLQRISSDGNVDNVIVVSVIAAPEGVKRVCELFPTVRIITAALDRQLNAVGYILPGLGDAGDRYHGTT
jgi:uracil phosphoribosyltransferase